jgi:hypothetical protein
MAHAAAIWMFGLEQFYSPGLATALFVLMPVSIYGIAYTAKYLRALERPPHTGLPP